MFNNFCPITLLFRLMVASVERFVTVLAASVPWCQAVPAWNPKPTDLALTPWTRGDLVGYPSPFGVLDSMNSARPQLITDMTARLTNTAILWVKCVRQCIDERNGRLHFPLCSRRVNVLWRWRSPHQQRMKTVNGWPGEENWILKL